MREMSATLTDLETGDICPMKSLTTMGRHKASHVFIPDQRVSRQHSIIRQQGLHEYWFTDLGSFNGSRINEQRVTTSRKLIDGDIIRICDFSWRFDLIKEDIDSTPIETLVSMKTIGDIRNESALMLVSDLKGFTSLSESLSSDDLAQIVGSWYRQTETILNNQGATIDKYIGDAVLAYWIHPEEQDLNNSVLACKQLLRCCSEITEKHRAILENVSKTFSSGVALHAGKIVISPVVAGVQTILGDAVNVAFRLESLSRQIGSDFLASGEVIGLAQSLRLEFKEAGEFEVKGRSAPLQVFKYMNLDE